MDEQETYQVYVGVMKLHKKYAMRDMGNLPGLIADINQLNSSHNHNFCNAMTDILRKWFLGYYGSVKPERVTEMYTDLWRLHKKYLRQERDETFWKMVTEEFREIYEKYGGAVQVRKYLLAVADALEYVT